MSTYSLLSKEVKEELSTLLDKQTPVTIALGHIENAPLIVVSLNKKTRIALCNDLGATLKRTVKEIHHFSMDGLDRFCLLLHTPDTDQETTALIEKMLQCCRTFNKKIGTQTIHLSISFATHTIRTALADCNAIESSLYLAYHKVTSKPNNYHIDSTDIPLTKDEVNHQIELTHSLYAALEEKRLRLAYQPIIQSSTGEIAYYECLLRVIDKEGNIHSVGPLIPVAESMGFIHQIDQLVLEMVVEELEQNPSLKLSFNISTLTIEDDSWLNYARKILTDPNICERIIIEITETAMQRDLRRTIDFVTDLQEIGCQVALDDFGSGYTSFRQLRSLPIDIVKIDGFYIKDIVENLESRLFVKTLLDFIQGFGLKAVAEFVENGEVAKLLMEYNVDYLQGNYFCAALNYRAWATDE